MNHTMAYTIDELTKLLAELTDYKRPISYNLSEIGVIKVPDGGWFVIWRKDA